MEDYSPLGDAAMTMALHLAMDIWRARDALSCAWFTAREHTQAEYRWIAKFGNGKRAAMPWGGGFGIWQACWIGWCL